MNTQNNFSVNFSLKGFTSIQIGIYFLLAAYLIKNTLDGFLIDDHLMGMMSAQIIEIMIFSILISVFLFASLALFFSAKRRAKKLKTPLWNKNTKNQTLAYLASFIVFFTALVLLKNEGFIDAITPIFLMYFGFILFVMQKNKTKERIIIPIICLLLAIICFLIPSYWYASILILGIAQITYGIVVKN
jgi:cation transport ATPase